jgi:RNA polymerase sigma-70 factor (ECF subfamily)
MPQHLTQQSAPWEALLAAARSGDDEALGQICQQLHEYLLSLAGDLNVGLGAKLGASDIVQQTMLEAHRDFQTFSGSSEQEFRAWLRRLVEHNLLDAARRYRRTQRRDTSRELSLDQLDRPMEIAGHERTASSIVRRRETDDELLAAIDHLPKRYRRIIELRHQHGWSYAAIAVELDMTETAARKTWSRAIESLRRKLTSSHEQRPSQPR